MKEAKHKLTALRLRECLDESNMKAIELADKIGVNRSAITHYLNGVSCPKNDTAIKIAKVFGVNPLWIMELTDIKYIPSNNVDFSVCNDEMELIMEYRKADKTTQDAIKRLLAYEQIKEKSK